MNQGRGDDDAGRIAAARFDYDGDGLAEEQLLATPYAQARRWVDDAVARSQVEKDVFEPLAMSVATVDAAGVPNDAHRADALPRRTGPGSSPR